MDITEFRKRMANERTVRSGSDLFSAFHQFSQEALKITAELNGSYHTPEEIVEIFSRLPGVTIGAGAIVGAVVTKDVPENTGAVGVPAKIIRKVSGGKK